MLAGRSLLVAAVTVISPALLGGCSGPIEDVAVTEGALSEIPRGEYTIARRQQLPDRDAMTLAARYTSLKVDADGSFTGVRGVKHGAPVSGVLRPRSADGRLEIVPKEYLHAGKAYWPWIEAEGAGRVRVHYLGAWGVEDHSVLMVPPGTEASNDFPSGKVEAYGTSSMASPPFPTSPRLTWTVTGTCHFRFDFRETPSGTLVVEYLQPRSSVNGRLELSGTSDELSGSNTRDVEALHGTEKNTLSLERGAEGWRFSFTHWGHGRELGLGPAGGYTGSSTSYWKCEGRL